jgi:cytochrome c5
MRSITITLLCAIMPVAAAAAALEKPISLKQAAGLDKVEANCGACHSLDYVPMNSRFLNAAGWNAEVAKMINVFGAPINPADAKVITDYLTANYGISPTQ